MPTQVFFVRDPVSWEKEFHTWEGVVGLHMRKITKVGAEAARIEAPHPGGPAHGRTGINYSTGELSGGIYPDYGHHRGELEGRIVAIPEHALMVHNGTPPHVIRARRAPRLVFFWHKVGRVVSFRSVHHPGTQADPFLERALHKVMRLFG